MIGCNQTSQKQERNDSDDIRLQVCEALLEKGAAIDSRGEDGATALILAACQGHVSILLP